MTPTTNSVEPTTSATDELRRMLDERGVKWTDHGYENHIWWKGFDGVRWHAENRHCVDGWCVKVEAVLTPEQAIAATLGHGTCRNVAESDEYSDRPFTCSECGARGPMGNGTYHIASSWAMEDGTHVFADSWPVWKYCPNCGRKVVDA